MFALKRGASVDAVRGERDAVETAGVAMAGAMASIPARLTRDHLDDCEKHLPPADVQWLAYSAAVMGFMNKFMDVIGVELESEAIAASKDVLSPTGWSIGKHAPAEPVPDEAVLPTVDGWGTYFRVLRFAPGAVILEWKWLSGVPGTNAAVKEWLEKEIGVSFGVIEHIGPARPLRAVAAVVRDSLDPKMSKIGLETKCATALVFARCAANPRLEQDVVRMASVIAPKFGDVVVAAVLEYAARNTERLPEALDAKIALAVELARAASSSPSVISEEMVEMVTKQFEASEIVEVVVWLSVLQLLHRMDVFHTVRAS